MTTPCDADVNMCLQHPPANQSHPSSPPPQQCYTTPCSFCCEPFLCPTPHWGPQPGCSSHQPAWAATWEELLRERLRLNGHLLDYLLLHNIHYLFGLFITVNDTYSLLVHTFSPPWNLFQTCKEKKGKNGRNVHTNFKHTTYLKRSGKKCNLIKSHPWKTIDPLLLHIYWIFFLIIWDIYKYIFPIRYINYN